MLQWDDLCKIPLYCNICWPKPIGYCQVSREFSIMNGYSGQHALKRICGLKLLCIIVFHYDHKVIKYSQNNTNNKNNCVLPFTVPDILYNQHGWLVLKTNFGNHSLLFILSYVSCRVWCMTTWYEYTSSDFTYAHFCLYQCRYQLRSILIISHTFTSACINQSIHLYAQQ